jgi:hypothetical protein
MSLSEMVSPTDVTGSQVPQFKQDCVTQAELLLRERIAKFKQTISAIEVLEQYCRDNCLAACYVGGFLRDMFANRVPRDIDIVVPQMQEGLLDNFAQNYGASKNRFGGYKIPLGNLTIDAWCIENSVSYERINEELFRHIGNLADSFRLNTEAAALGVAHQTFVDGGMVGAFQTRIIEYLHTASEDPLRTCETMARTKIKLGFDWRLGTVATQLWGASYPQSHEEKNAAFTHINEIYRDNRSFYLGMNI